MKNEGTTELDFEFFEYVLLNQLLRGKENKFVLISALDYLDHSLFKNPHIGKVFKIAKSYFEDNNSLPNWTELKTRIQNEDNKNGISLALKKIKDLDAEYSPKELTRNLEKYIKQRMLRQSLERMLEEKASGNILDEVKAHDEINKIVSISLIDNLGLDYFDDKVLDNIVNSFDQQDQYISTGYQQLDNFLGGGFFKEGKCLYTFGGETNVGKSIVVANLATNVLLSNEDVVIISLEMSEMRYAKRIAGMLSEIPLAKLSESKDKFKEFVFSFKTQNSARLFIKEFPTKSITPKAIHSYLLKLQRQKNFNPKLIIIDYHTLLKPSIPQGSKHADLQFLTQETRALSYIWGAPIVSPLQLNRSGSGSSSAPELSTVAGSWDMLSDVDCHINIWQADGDRESNILRFSIKKARDGAKNDEGHWRIDYNTLKLYDNDDYNKDNLEKENDDFTADLGSLLDD